MEIFGHHIMAFGLFGTVSEVLGPDGLNEALRALGATPDDLSDSQAWFSLDFVESLLDETLKRDGDSTVFRRMGRMSVSRRHLGFLYTLLRAFGSPEFAYAQVAKSAPRFNKIGEFAIEDPGVGCLRLLYRPIEGAPRERFSHLCEIRIGQFTAVPTLFDLPSARVEHPKCIFRGDEQCSYEVTWQPRAPKRASRIGGLLGTLLGASGAYGSSHDWRIAFAAGATTAIAGWAVGRVSELRRDVAEGTRMIDEHHGALERSMRANEMRFEQIVQAKAEVDQKVEQRTTELSEATQRLARMLTEIQALDRAKTDFFNNVSHELRSPLTMILAPLEDLVAGRSPPSGNQSAFESMQRNATRLLRLINQLLDLAKIDAGQAKLVLSSVDLGNLARGILSGFEPAAAKKGVRVEVEVPDDMAPIVIDPAWIESAVTNLVANALRVSRSGGFVRIAIDDRGSDVILAVADDGPGIAPDDQQKVFERFAQGDSSKRVVGGTGIGLALVREACRLHGGDVTLISELGKGATFTLTLPRRSDLKPEALAPTAAPTSSNPPAVRSSVRPAARVIVDEFRDDNVAISRPGPGPHAPLALVVEDNPELREFVADVLASRYRVETAVHGKQALAMAPELRPEVIVSDVAMPEMDGYQLCRALRANEETKGTPILLVTARTEVANVLEGFDAGANDYILKPFHGRELLARVDVHVRLRRVMQEFAQRERHAMLGVLAASVAHQVRNPLTTLVSGLPAMRAKLAGKVTESTTGLMEVMIDCAGRIERLTKDLMDLSRIDREEGGEFTPSDGLRAAIRLVKARLPQTVEVDELVEDSPVLDGRPGDINHVFLNVLDNASRAVGERGRIRVEAAVQNGNAYVIRIGDSGPGIDPETAKHIFEPFFTTRQAGEGTGLGLAIARQVTQQCGGSIVVGRSELGGAQFTIEIPLTLRRTLRPVSHPPPPN